MSNGWQMLITKYIIVRSLKTQKNETLVQFVNNPSPNIQERNLCNKLKIQRYYTKYKDIRQRYL